MIAVITASYSDIGHALTEQLLSRGYRVIALNRNKEKTLSQFKSLRYINKNADMHWVEADLADPNSIHQAAKRVAEEFGDISLLVNNAGHAGEKSRSLGHGIEEHFQVNTLAPFQLARQLSFKSNSMVLNLGSGAMYMARKLTLDPGWHQQHFKKMSGPYAHSKLALAQLTMILSDQPDYQPLTIKTIDPGPTKSAMSASNAMPGWVKWVRPLFKTPEKAASNLLNSAFDTGIASGSYVQGRTIKTVPRNPDSKDLIDWFDQASARWT